jgi:hypothetical protein
LKIIFNENLHEIQQDIFRLVHHSSFTPEYVENLCPLDRKLHWAYWQQEQQENSKRSGEYTALDDNIPQGIGM